MKNLQPWRSSRLCLALLAMAVVSAVPVRSYAEEDDGRLSAIGGLSASRIYTTYVAIGAVADAFGNDVYETKQVQDIMDGMVGMIDTVKKHCEDQSDQRYIDDVINIYTLLQEEARQLSKFAGSRQAADHRAYEKARTTVWPKIEKLLGLDD